MAQIYSPKIVQDSLVMCLDASNNKSYPTDLPVKNGLNLWLDAADDTTFSYSSGTSVSQWRDKSGSNFHASQATVGSQPSRSTFQNSRKTVNFDGTNDTVTIPSFVSNSEMSIFVVSNCGNTLFIEHSNDVNSSATGFYIYGGGNGMFLIRRNSTYYYLSLTDWLAGGYSIASGVNSTGLDLLTYKNGTQQTWTGDGRSSLSNSYATNTLYIGSRGANSLWSSGPIAEIIIYNRKVTNAERNSIHTYLGQKWGISNTDRSIVDLAGNDDNGLLGNGTVANMPIYDYYNKGLKFNSTNANYVKVGVNSSLQVNTVTIAAFFKTITNGQTTQFIGGYGDTGFYGYWLGMSGGPMVFSVGNSTSNLQLSSTITPNNDQIYYVVGTYDGVTQRIYVDGVLKNSATTVTGVLSYSGLTDGFLIGQVQGFSVTRYMTGSIYAMQVYSRALSAAEVAQNYETMKSKFANTIVQQGLVLNLDAGNIYSYAGAGTTWYDVSGNSFNATLINSPTYTSDNGGVLNWASASSQYATVPMSSTLRVASITEEVWVYLSGTADQVFIGSQYGTGSNNSFALWLSGGTFYFGVNTGGSFYNSASSAASTSTWYHLVHTYNATTQYLYINGVLTTTLNSAASGNISYDASNTLLAIGADFNGTGYNVGPSVYTNGKMPVVRIYNIALSAAQVLQNYNATKGRFGL